MLNSTTVNGFQDSKVLMRDVTVICNFQAGL